MKKAVLTGATGAVGMALISELIKRGTEVLVLCRASSPRSANIPNHTLVRMLDCPLDKMAELDMGGERFDAFFHLAWDGTTGASRDDMYLQSTNVKYTLDAVSLAERLGCSVFMGAGSQAEYGIAEGDLNSHTPTFPLNGYGMAKLCAGQMSRVACRQKGIRHIWIRILSIYGPFDGMRSLVSMAIDKISRGERASFTKGEQLWDYMYSGDAAIAMAELAERGRDGGIYCLGSGSVRPLHEYVEIIHDSINKDAELGLGDIPYAAGQVMYLKADISELVRDTGYTPSTKFEDGIKKTISWYNERNGI